MSNSKPVVVRDSDVAKALLHPAREHALELLSTDGDQTASQLAPQLGLTASAMSWHLRLLERAQLVERAEPTADGRERPWHAVTGAYQFSGWDPSLLPDRRRMITAAVDRAFVETERYAEGPDDAWTSYSKLWYSRDEIDALHAEIRAAMQRHGSMDRRDGDDVRFALFFLGAKIDAVPGGDDAPPADARETRDARDPDGPRDPADLPG